MSVSFFKLPKAKAFEYKPLFFDPEKDSIKSASTQPAADSTAEFKARLKKEMDSKWQIAKKRTKKKKSISNITTLLLYLIVVILMLYFFVRH
ncbi:MAG: hypothetical protein NTZ33_03020 [Bacteroidetes bacterium]|nr:hypothetical protein [Bacteroidota bacterium]